MKRIILVSFILAVIAGASYFFWKINHPPSINAWDLVNDKALVVYERNANSALSDVESILNTFVPDTLRNTLRTAKELLVSVHVIGKEEVGTIIYWPAFIQPNAQTPTLPRPIAQRNFEGFTISEVPVPGHKSVSVVIVDQILVMSSTSFLIEDVIRLAKAEERKNFHRSNHSLFQFARMDSDGGHVYINLTQLASFIDFFLLRKNQSPSLERFARSAVVDIKKQERQLLFSGFAVDSALKGPSILSLFNQQRPVPVTLQRIVSNRTGLLAHYGVSDYDTWTAARLDFCKSSRQPFADSLNAFQQKHHFNAGAFYHALGDELGCSIGGSFWGQLFIVELKDNGAVLTELQKFNSPGDSSSSESYSHYQLHALAKPSLANALFWPLINRPMSHYVIIEHHLIFAEDVDDLKSFIDDLDGENTWGKSAEWNAFLSTSQDTNVGVIGDGLNGWPSLKPLLTPKWQSFGDSTHFLNINKASFQFTRLEKSYYFNGVIEFNPKSSLTTIEQKEKMVEISLQHPVSQPINVVRNHNTGASELLVLDNANNLTLLSTKLKDLFQLALDGPIVTAVSQIDFYRNKKLQYLFATDKKIYLVDRLGNMVAGFPKAVDTGAPIRFLTAVDYDNSHNYQFLLTDKKGKLILIDRNGDRVSDWKPIDLKQDLTQPPRTMRSKGRNYIFAVTPQGIVHGFTGKGIPLDDFPVSLKLRPRGEWVIEKTDSRDLITLVSDDGILIQVDPNGKVVTKNHLIKSSASSQFSLAASPEEHYVISRVDKNKIGVLDSRGNLLLEKDNPGSTEIYLSFFEGGRGKRLFGFTDPQQEFTYFFDGTGKSLFSRPLENQLSPAITIDRAGTVFFYGVNGNNIQSYRPARANH